MLRLTELIQAFKPLIGWRQSYDPAAQIESSLTVTQSGMYFQDAHPMLTLQNIDAVKPIDYDVKYPDWDVEGEYAEGDIRKYGNRVYMAVSPTVGVSPEASESGWRVYNTLSDYLAELTEAGIARAVQRFIVAKQGNKETTPLMRSEALVNSPNRITNTILPNGNLVGFVFHLLRGVGVTVKINKIALQMAGATGTVRLHLFHSSQFEPLRTFDVEIDGTATGFVWIEPQDLFLTNPCKQTGLEGEYYLCYHQDALPEYMRAINAGRDWSREPCGTCNKGNPTAWKALERLITVRPFAAVTTEEWSDNPQCPMPDDMTFEPTLSYGFNFVVEAGCDLTDFLVAQKNVFANVIQLEVASDILRRLTLNPEVRVNRNQLNASRAELRYELDGDTQGRPTGLLARLNAAYKSIEVSTQGIDNLCLACNNRGIRYTQV